MLTDGSKREEDVRRIAPTQSGKRSETAAAAPSLPSSAFASPLHSLGANLTSGSRLGFFRITKCKIEPKEGIRSLFLGVCFEMFMLGVR